MKNNCQKELFRCSLLFDDIVFEDYYFDTEDEAVSFGNEYLDSLYSLGELDPDRYSAIIIPVKGVVL